MKLSKESVLLLLAIGAAAAIAAVVGVRSFEQWRRPGAMTARGERQWLGWAFRDPALLVRLERAEALLRPGETYCLDFDPRRVDPVWLTAMTDYAFWRELPAGPCPSRTNWPGSPARIVVARDGRVSVVREAQP